MKNIIVILSLLAFSTMMAHAQIKQEYAIYDTLLIKYKNRIPAPTTSLHTFKYFDFKNLKEFDYNPKDTLNSEWKFFFNNIDTSNVKPGNLDAAFLAKYPRKADSNGIRFSPIIISPDGTKAVCGAFILGEGENMYLFEKKDNKWVYRRSYFISVQ